MFPLFSLPAVEFASIASDLKGTLFVHRESHRQAASPDQQGKDNNSPPLLAAEEGQEEENPANRH